jgi:hypothetical protein
MMSYRLAAALITALALPVMATSAAADGLFGAMAFSPSTGKVGLGYNFTTKGDASTEAVNQCGVGDCDVVVVFPKCGAVAVGDGFGMGFAADNSESKAIETALTNCSGYTSGCKIYQSYCNEGS